MSPPLPVFAIAAIDTARTEKFTRVPPPSPWLQLQHSQLGYVRMVALVCAEEGVGGGGDVILHTTLGGARVGRSVEEPQDLATSVAPAGLLVIHDPWAGERGFTHRQGHSSCGHDTTSVLTHPRERNHPLHSPFPLNSTKHPPTPPHHTTNHTPIILSVTTNTTGDTHRRRWSARCGRRRGRAAAC